MVFRCLLKSNNDRATIIAKKTTTTIINVLNDTVIELPVESVTDEVGVGDRVNVGFGEGEEEVSPKVIVCVLLQPLSVS